MKKYTFTSLSVVIAIFATTLSISAKPIGGSNEPFDYLATGKDLSWLSMGIYGGQFERNIDFENGNNSILKTTRFHGYVGADIFRWITVYGLIGGSESSVGESETADGEAEYGGGIRLNLMHHFIAEPAPMEDVVRLNFDARYLHASSDLNFENLKWDEISASLTMELVNHTAGNKFFNPESIGLYFGPIFSSLNSSDFSEDQNFGITGGIEFYLVDTIVLDIEVQHFSETSAAVGLNFHF